MSQSTHVSHHTSHSTQISIAMITMIPVIRARIFFLLLAINQSKCSARLPQNRFISKGRIAVIIQWLGYAASLWLQLQIQLVIYVQFRKVADFAQKNHKMNNIKNNSIPFHCFHSQFFSLCCCSFSRSFEEKKLNACVVFLLSSSFFFYRNNNVFSEGLLSCYFWLFFFHK